MSEYLKELKCPKCRRKFTSGGADQSGIYYNCNYCKKTFRKDPKTLLDYIGLQNDYVDLAKVRENTLSSSKNKGDKNNSKRN